METTETKDPKETTGDASLTGALTSTAPMQVRKILVPVDFSDSSSVAQDVALYFAQTFNAVIELLHVWEPSDTAPHLMGPVGAPITHATVVEMSLEAAEQQLAALVENLHPGARHRVVPHVELGVADKTIVEVAREGAFDLIVMGTRGRTGLARLVLGSVAAKVVRKAPCPVVTVPLPGGEEVRT